MYSQCPECQTRFRVTAANLRAAHGTVRCGRCGSAFDALPRLTDSLTDAGADDRPSPASVEAASLTALAAPELLAVGEPSARDRDVVDEIDEEDGTIITEFHFSPDDLEQVFIDARDWQQQFGPGDDEGDRRHPTGARRAANGHARRASSDEQGHTTAADASEMFVHEPERVEDITLEGERIVIEGRPPEDEGDALRGRGDAGTQAGPDDPDEFPGVDDAVRLQPSAGDETAAVDDLDSTDSFEALRIVPGSDFPSNDDEPAEVAPVPGTVPSSSPPVWAAPTVRATAPTAPTAPRLPRVAKTMAAELDAGSASRDAAAGAASRPRASGPTRWRPPSFDEALAGAGDDDHGGGTADEPSAQERRVAFAWSCGTLALAVLLATQLVHHYRVELARNASFGPVVRALYSAFGRPLAPNWDLGAFELRQWGASGSGAPFAGGNLRVRASLRNGASFPQPMPLLRLELEDRFGATVARRDFEPSEYLRNPGQASRLLAPGAQTEAELEVVESGQDAVGYRLDVCLHDGTAGTIRCAQAARASATTTGSAASATP